MNSGLDGACKIISEKITFFLPTFTLWEHKEVILQRDSISGRAAIFIIEYENWHRHI